MDQDKVDEFLSLLERDANKFDALANGLENALNQLHVEGERRQWAEAQVAARREQAEMIRTQMALVRSEHNR